MRPRAGETPNPLRPFGPRGPVPDEPPAPPALDLRERRILQVVCDTLVPRVRVDADPGGFYERTATEGPRRGGSRACGKSSGSGTSWGGPTAASPSGAADSTP